MGFTKEYTRVLVYVPFIVDFFKNKAIALKKLTRGLLNNESFRNKNIFFAAWLVSTDTGSTLYTLCLKLRNHVEIYFEIKIAS